MLYIIDISCQKSVFPVDNVPASLGEKTPDNKCGEPLHICLIFESECCSTKSLGDHVQRNHLNKCDKCGLSFSRYSALKIHRLGGNITCTDCDQIFCNQKQLKMHKKAHHESMVIACECCGQNFSKMWMLSRHKKGDISYQKCEKNLCIKVF